MIRLGVWWCNSSATFKTMQMARGAFWSILVLRYEVKWTFVRCMCKRVDSRKSHNVWQPPWRAEREGVRNHICWRMNYFIFNIFSIINQRKAISKLSRRDGDAGSTISVYSKKSPREHVFTGLCKLRRHKVVYSSTFFAAGGEAYHTHTRPPIVATASLTCTHTLWWSISQ